MEDFYDQAQLGDLLNRSADTVRTLMEAGVVPQSSGSIVDKDRRTVEPLWAVEDVAAFYAQLHRDQAAIVPAGELAQQEFDAHHIYACPAIEPRFIGLARPVLIGMKSGGFITVYEVTDVLTEAQRMPGTSRLQANRKLLTTLRSSRGRPDLLTVFKLGKEVGVFRHLEALRQGRTVQAATLRKAIKMGRVVDIVRATRPADLVSGPGEGQ